MSETVWEMQDLVSPFQPEWVSTVEGQEWVIWYGINNSWALGVRGEPEESISDAERATVWVCFGDSPDSLFKTAEKLFAVLRAEGEPHD